MARYIGIDIGGTKCAVCVGDEMANVQSRRQIPTADGPEATLSLLLQHTRELLLNVEDVASIGIVCGGPLDAGKGLILSPPNLPGWDAIPITKYFQERLDIPSFLQNDANAGALAEWRHGAGKGCQNMMFCTMGTGFGSGLVLNGELFEGINGNAGEIGHVRLAPEGPVGYGKAGSVEGFCSGGGIAQLAKMKLQAHALENEATLLRESDTLLAKTVAEAAFAGDGLAVQIFEEVGDKLGNALSVAVDLLNLERIIIGSIFVRCEALIRPAMERAMQRECLPAALAVCSVLPAVLGEQIGDIAALTVAQNGVAQNAMEARS